jgi:hypothetical protein
MWLIIIFFLIFLVNIGALFINEELIICVALLLFFYLFFYNLKLIIKKFFFYKIEYIYFIFKTLIDINIQLINILLRNVKFYNNFINLINLIELNCVKLIQLNSSKFKFILNLLLNKLFFNLLNNNKLFLKNNLLLFNIEIIYKVKFLKI